MPAMAIFQTSQSIEARLHSLSTRYLNNKREPQPQPHPRAPLGARTAGPQNRTSNLSQLKSILLRLLPLSLLTL